MDLRRSVQNNACDSKLPSYWIVEERRHRVGSIKNKERIEYRIDYRLGEGIDRLTIKLPLNLQREN